MSLNKSAFIRYRTIDACLTNRLYKYPSKQYLHEKCCAALGECVSLSTIEKDLQDMRYDDRLGFSAPIYYNKAGNYYYYSDPYYSIYKTLLSREQLESIKVVAAYCFKAVEPGSRESIDVLRAAEKLDACFHLFNDVDQHLRLIRV